MIGTGMNQHHRSLTLCHCQDCLAEFVHALEHCQVCIPCYCYLAAIILDTSNPDYHIVGTFGRVFNLVVWRSRKKRQFKNCLPRDAQV